MKTSYQLSPSQRERQIMRGGYAELLLILGLLCTATTICFGFNLHNISEVRCIEKERQALLEFKQGLQGNHSLLSSWGSTHEKDCCNWKGIKCSNPTNHVVKLDLRGTYCSEPSKTLSGEISSSILGLQHLTYLDLSCNNFSIFPESIGSLTKLQYLNISYNSISGTIPQQFGNLSSFISLDLSWNHYGLIEDNNLDWLFNLSYLKCLDMSGVNLSKTVNWPDKVNMLHSLLELRLSQCELSMPIPPVLFNANSSSSLSFLYLSSNHLNSSSIFSWLFKYTNSLIVLDLSFNEIQGSIPKAFGNMVALVHLNLSSNNFEGTIPHTLENLHNLQVLDLSNNSISGEVPDLSKLSILRELHLSNNQLNGTLTKSIGKLSKLRVLDVSSNSLNKLHLSVNSLSILKFSPNWVPPFHLDTIKLRSCNLGPTFPQWLQTQKNFSWLDISKAGISDTIPNWFWDLSFNIKFLDLSHNQITGHIPLQWLSSRFIGSSTMDLSYNCFNGRLPQLNYDSMALDFSSNKFQGPITSLCETNGSVSYRYLRYLDLSDNLLSGELPKCWTNMPYLIKLDLGNNNFIGRIPDSIGRICNFSESEYMLQMLHLENNSFIGELPSSLMHCTSLTVLDVGENKLSGKIPVWIGTMQSYLMILRMSSNLFTGSIPSHLCYLKSLRILDLSRNNITGTIPQCLKNLIAMADMTGSLYGSLVHQDDSPLKSATYYISCYIDNLQVTFQEKFLQYNRPVDHVVLTVKGRTYLYTDVLLLFISVIDLSSNKLDGEIPREITSLSNLHALNLSNNLLTGIIPQSIGDLFILEALDLSGNHLSGIIPPSMVDMLFLEVLILSNNNLFGKIPIGNQFITFETSSYEGNPDLCGTPLQKMCLKNASTQGPQTGPQTGSKHDANFYEHLWFYTSITIGFIVGFWGVCGSLVLKSSWRHAYFHFLDRIGDRLYVTIAINKAKLQRNFKTQCYQENI